MKLRLLPKILTSVLVPMVCVLGILVTFSYTTAEKALLAQIDTDMGLLVTQQRREYEKFFNDISALAKMTASRGDMTVALESGFTEDVTSALAEVVRLYPYIKRAVLLRSDGKPLAEQGMAAVAQTSSDFFARLKNSGTSVNLLQDPADKQRLILQVGSAVRQDNHFIGAVVLSLPMEDLGAMYSDQIRVGATGKCFVLDAQGVVLLDPTDKASIGVNISDIDWIRTILQGKNGLVRYQWNGVDKTCFYQRVEGFDWSVALGITNADLLTPIFAMRDQVLMMTAAALLVVAVLVYLLARWLAYPVRGAALFVQLVGSGDMNIPPVLEQERHKVGLRRDEIGELAQGIGSMYTHLKEQFDASERSMKAATAAAEEARTASEKAEEALRRGEQARHEGILTVTGQLEGIAENLSAFAGRLAQRITLSERGAREQAARVTETATAMEEMNSTVLEVARNAGVASELAASTREKAERGATVVRTAVDSIRQVQTQAVQLKDDMVQLDESAKAVSQIMSVISDIADQTNLLALNAAIEAARAGEAGRGFAVVADEVRKLAEKTMASTTDVGRAIHAIQQSAAKSMTQVDSSGRSIEEATGLVTETGAAFSEITNMVDTSADQVRAIAAASEQQSASSEAISQSIVQVSTIAGDTATAMAEATREVEELARQAQALTTLIQDMKRS